MCMGGLMCVCVWGGVDAQIEPQSKEKPQCGICFIETLPPALSFPVPLLLPLLFNFSG